MQTKNETHLGCYNNDQRNEEADVLFIEDLNYCDHMNGVDSSGAGVGEDGDENVLFDVERPGI